MSLEVAGALRALAHLAVDLQRQTASETRCVLGTPAGEAVHEGEETARPYLLFYPLKGALHLGHLLLHVRLLL